MRGILAGAMAIVVLGAAASTAQAGVVAFVTQVSPDIPGSARAYLIYKGSPGEQNRITVTANRATNTVTVRDSGILLMLPDLTLGATQPLALLDTLLNCTYVLNTATCRRPGYAIGDTTVLLGDGDDTATALGDGAITLSGDAGNDTLSVPTQHANVVLVGGAGNDVLRGGPGDNDRLFGGRGSDDLSGGGGTDGVYYRNALLNVTCVCWDADDATVGITASIDDVANDGVPGERDNIHGDIERLLGTDFNDTLIGSANADVLAGTAGDDVIDGRGGNDQLFGQLGSDTITGGAGQDVVRGGTDPTPGNPSAPDGNDRLELRDGEADTYSCADGTDVAIVDAIDIFSHQFTPAAPSNCEDVQSA
jgi:hypothetical protein